MEKKINTLVELLELNQKQAADIVTKYLKDVDDIDKFIDYYFDTLESKNIVGTTYEKLRRVCKIAELEFKKRFEDKESFLLWLGDKYKNRTFFRVFAGDFEYKYFAYDSFGKKYEISNKVNDMLICLNQFKELTYQNGDLIENGVFKEALIEYIFKNQTRIGKDIELQIPRFELKPIPSLDELRALEKQRENKLYNENKDKFILIINQALKNKI